jgi:hypothetical protein
MTSSALNRACAIFLQIVVVLIGVGVLAFLLWQPQVEGRNVNATTFQIYFNDPFLAYAYAASIAGFIALAQAFKLLGLAGNDGLYQPAAVKALATIKLCALALIGFIALGEVFLVVGSIGSTDDHAGGIMMGVFISFAMTVIAAAAALCERQVQQVAAMKPGAL